MIRVSYRKKSLVLDGTEQKDSYLCWHMTSIWYVLDRPILFQSCKWRLLSSKRNDPSEINWFEIARTSIAWHVETLFGCQFRAWKTLIAVSVAPSVTIIIILLHPVLSKNIFSPSLYAVARMKEHVFVSSRHWPSLRTVRIGWTKHFTLLVSLIIGR